MKLLLDECTPTRLRNDFPGHEIRTVAEVGLKGLQNGELLRTAIQSRSGRSHRDALPVCAIKVTGAESPCLFGDYQGG